MNKQTQEKAKKTKNENEYKLFDFCGYEIWRDSRNFMTKGKGATHFYGTLFALFRQLNLTQVERKEKNIEFLVNSLKERDDEFVKKLDTVLRAHGLE
jgi:hypothetical protein